MEVVQATLETIHRDLTGMRTEARHDAQQVREALEGLAGEIRRSNDISTSWLAVVSRVVDHPTVGRVMLVGGVLVIARLLLPSGAESALVQWLIQRVQ